LDLKFRQASEGGPIFDYDESKHVLFVNELVSERHQDPNFQSYMMKEAVETLSYDICGTDTDSLHDTVTTELASTYAGAEVVYSDEPLKDVTRALDNKLNSFQKNYFREYVLDAAMIKAKEPGGTEFLTDVQNPTDEAWNHLAAASRQLHSIQAYED